MNVPCIGPTQDADLGPQCADDAHAKHLGTNLPLWPAAGASTTCSTEATVLRSTKASRTYCGAEPPKATIHTDGLGDVKDIILVVVRSTEDSDCTAPPFQSLPFAQNWKENGSSCCRRCWDDQFLQVRARRFHGVADVVTLGDPMCIIIM